MILTNKTTMDEKLQDRAWAVLPKEFKAEVRAHYADLNAALKALTDKEALTNEECNRYDVIHVKMYIFRLFFGYENLASDAEGEEMLTVPRSHVQRYYAIFLRESKNAKNFFDRLSLEGRSAMLQVLFGSKCLPDEDFPNLKKWKRVKQPSRYLNIRQKNCDTQSDNILKDGSHEYNRLHIAAMAMQGMFSNPAITSYYTIQDNTHKDFIIDYALEFADALIKKCDQNTKT